MITHPEDWGDPQGGEAGRAAPFTSPGRSPRYGASVENHRTRGVDARRLTPARLTFDLRLSRLGVASRRRLVRLLRPRRPHPHRLDGVPRSADLVRPRPRLVLRLQPRGGHPLLRARRRGRPGLRDGALGDRLRDRARTTTRRGTRSRRTSWSTPSPWRTPRSRRRRRWPANATPVERALIDALARALPGVGARRPTRPSWNDAYADAMRDVYARFGDDLDVAALFAEALMNRTPWQLWDLDTGEPAEGADTAEAVEVLERAMARPGAAAPRPAAHVRAHDGDVAAPGAGAAGRGRRSATSCPTPATCVHMPTHIDVLCGLLPRRRRVERPGHRRRPASTSSARGR